MKLKKFCKASILQLRSMGRHSFENRSNQSNKLCLILAGYKKFLWEDVFERINLYIPKDIDVCVVSPGVKSKELREICQKYFWSYLSTKRNHVCLAQNLAIKLHRNAESIFKIDEDIFVTEGVFEDLLQKKNLIQKESDYNSGIVAPLIPLNGFGYIQILREYGLSDFYQKKYGKPKIHCGGENSLENDPNIAKLLWGDENLLPPLDELNHCFRLKEEQYYICPIRFSIGMILFERELWIKMRGFPIKRNHGLGYDEKRICDTCHKYGETIAVSGNSVVGHFAFQKQNEYMKEWYLGGKTNDLWKV